MASARFTLTKEHDRIAAFVAEMTLVRASLGGDVLTVHTQPPFGDEAGYGPRMDRVERVVRGIDPDARRDDV